MPDQRPIGDLDMLHRRPTSMSIYDGSPMGHVGFRWVSDGACWFLMGLQLGMSVSDGSPMKHVEVFNGSPIRHVSLRWGMSVINGACRSSICLRSCIFVSDFSMLRSPIRHVSL